MKYYRTKDGSIYEYERVKTRVFIQQGMRSREKPLSEEETLKLFPYEIIAQADTIEELCDEFVIVHQNPYCIEHYLADKNTDLKATNEHIGTVYGAIWTDEGLIYVAKMNEEGELKLL